MLDGESMLDYKETYDLTQRRGFSQAFYREKLHEKHFGMDLETFMKDFWESWACSKGMVFA
jgi:hypothetical protein